MDASKTRSLFVQVAETSKRTIVISCSPQLWYGCIEDSELVRSSSRNIKENDRDILFVTVVLWYGCIEDSELVRSSSRNVKENDRDILFATVVVQDRFSHTSDAYSGTAYDRWVEQRGSDAPNKSTIAKMQHHYWVTKQTVFRKLGKKDDECVVASDAELDAKLELFRSIQDSCLDLQRIIDKYQERLCNLAQEENAMGRFLKEAGRTDKTRAGKMMTAVGKSLSYSGQQRLTLRVPLLRLYQEVETFRFRAISDTLQNVTSMEKVRTEYRASLSWMKNVSQELDPDTYKQLERFRKVQGQVRRSKAHFDKLKLDCLQKVDLLAAARCNMFSHALILYQNSLLQFAEKACKTFNTVASNFKGTTIEMITLS
uniref:AH domain-containing protein n=1 Tax=Timema genevievae TaxID=629358 RepID=A0A7R9PII2_TIMGE|nr:unnamed protein product [Timema genevievae]